MRRALPRVVLDTNIVLSALLFVRGRVSALREAWRDGRFVPLVSAPTASELIRVLAYPRFKLTAAEQQELLADYLPYCTAVVEAARPPKLPACRDPHDLPFLALAVTGKAQFLVTGDKDLLGVRLARCAIVNPDTFMRTLAIALG
jgi:putative PIN family toxin of toxin-antitoxin system